MEIIHTNNIKYPDDNPFEIVERKGIGHPDTVADALSERISVEYSKYCLEHFGVVLHHNVDKVSALGGLVAMDWGKAKVLKPIRILVNGRVSASFHNEAIPRKEIYEQAIKEQLNKSLPHLNTEKWLDIIDNSTTYSKNPRWFNPQSLDDLPDHSSVFANDTSAIVSYWPLTPSKQLALKLEGHFYDDQQKPKFKEIGQDIKVMIVRNNKRYDITMCIPFFCKYFDGPESYLAKLHEIESSLIEFAKEQLGNSVEIDLKVNTQDQRKRQSRDAKSFYFVTTGGSLDFGEEGIVGRGNNRLGIIPSFRPYTMEVAPGKNPVYHVGKVLGFVADELAKAIANNIKCNTEVWIVTRIGDPLFEPNSIIVNTSGGVRQTNVNEIVRSILKRRDWTERTVYQNVLIPRTGNLY